jgi:hypothetical protein
MYTANIIISGPIGFAAIVAPRFARSFFGIPAGDPVTFGIANGAIPLGFALAGILGLRAPIRLSPILGLQAVYKSLFLIGVIVPLAIAGQIPNYALPIIDIFVFFIVGNLIAIPFRYVAAYPADH